MLAATYISSSQFSVPGNYVALLETNLALKCEQGSDGTASVYVVTASYSSGTGLTTVTVTGTSLTANLLNVLIPYVSPSSLPAGIGGGGGGGLLATLDSLQVFGKMGFPCITTTGNLSPYSGKGYWTYLGKVLSAFTPQYVKALMFSAGAGSQVGEVGLFSSPGPPNWAGQTLTKIVATDTITDMTTGSKVVISNITPFATSVPKDTYLWAGIRVAMEYGQPQWYSLSHDYGLGMLLSLANADSFVSQTTWAAQLVAIQSYPSTPIHPIIIASMV